MTRPTDPEIAALLRDCERLLSAASFMIVGTPELRQSISNGMARARAMAEQLEQPAS